MGSPRRYLLRVVVLLSGFIALLVGHALVIDPWMAGWGATAQERQRTLPGDEIVSVAAGQETRAITINTPISKVWPWLAQIGQDRSGFYSYRVLENLVGCQMPEADRIHPEFQTWKQGDRLWMYPPDRAGGIGYAALSSVDPGRALAFGTWLVGTSQAMPPTGSWSFILEPIDEHTTRLLVRGRAAGRTSGLWRAFDRFAFGPMHFVMERRMMINLKARAEGRANTSGSETLEAALWTIVMMLLLASAAAVLRRPTWWVPFVVFLATGGVFALLTLAQPGPTVAALLAVAVAVTLWLTRRLGTARVPSSSPA
jgi:hypothetical protein